MYFMHAHDVVYCITYNALHLKQWSGVFLIPLYRLVRLTSPRLNYISIVGATVMYVSVLLYSIPSFSAVAAEVLCEVHMRTACHDIYKSTCTHHVKDTITFFSV